MADLIAIGYPDETTAFAAADEARRLAADLIIQPDAIAVITRDTDGSYHVHTSHHPVGAGASWGMFWGFLFGLLFFIPVFGLAIGAGLGALMGKFAKTSIDKQFQEQVRGMVQPGTSALFLMLEKVTPDKAVEAMSKYGGTVLKTSLSKDDEKDTPGRPARRRGLCAVGPVSRSTTRRSRFPPRPGAATNRIRRWQNGIAPASPPLAPPRLSRSSWPRGSRAEAARPASRSPEGCVSWVPWTGRSTPR